jgi:DNA replication and repair protein RecF
MRLRRLRIERLRCVDAVELEFGPGLHWLVGRNGSGKSSLLEGIALLASGRSFRGGSVDGCVQKGAQALTVFAETCGDGQSGHRLGLRRALRGRTEARVDGVEASSLTALFQVFPAVVFPADSGELISGPGELRRRYLDWGLFHVEPSFFEVWRRYARALRQRNLILRRRQAPSVELAWRTELAEHGAALHALRADYVDALTPHVAELAAWLLPSLGAPCLVYRPGWPLELGSVEKALQRNLDSDWRLGFTGVGPHRAGWTLGFERLPQREMFSRGQAKLASLLMCLAQMGQFTQARGEPPVVGLDDALAELDAENQGRLLAYLKALSIQCLLASADVGAVERLGAEAGAVFHVEQGKVRSPV